MNIDKYDVLRYAETLGEEDLQLLLEQLILIKNVKYPVIFKGVEKVDTNVTKKIREIPPYEPTPLRSFSDISNKEKISKLPKLIWKPCTCGSWFHRKDCKCGGGRFVEQEKS